MIILPNFLIKSGLILISIGNSCSKEVSLKAETELKLNSTIIELTSGKADIEWVIVFYIGKKDLIMQSKLRSFIYIIA